jgi:hypothetical protein
MCILTLLFNLFPFFAQQELQPMCQNAKTHLSI